MMTTKRMIALLLSFLLLLCLGLSACGDDEPEAGPGKESSTEKDDGQDTSKEASNGGESSYIDIVIPGEDSSVPSQDASREESIPDESGDESLPSDSSDVSGEISSDMSGDVSQDVPSEPYYQDADGKYVLDGVSMPAFPSLQTVFTVCVYGNGIQTTYYSEEIASDVYGSRIESYVKLRNNDLYKDFGVTVRAYRVDDVATTLKNDAVAGTAAYDAAMPFLPSAISLAQEGALLDLNNYSTYIHFQAPWWESSVNRLVQVDGHQYFAVGDITFSQKRASVAVLFNKYMADTMGFDLYSMVHEGKWTMDKMYEIAKGVLTDANDSWGVVGSYNIATYHYLASGQSLITVGADGTPKIALEHADSLTTMLRLLQTLHAQERSIYNVQKQTGVADVWGAGLSVFDEGRAMFYITPLVAVNTLRASAKTEFGILPMPKTNASQTSYFTPVSGQSAYGICIPTTAADPLFSAYMIEAMACYSKNTVTPEYAEGLLRSKNSADWESREMLDLIFDSMHYDLGMIDSMGGVGSLLATMYRENISAVASKVYATIPLIQTAIDNYLLNYRLNN